MIVFFQDWVSGSVIIQTHCIIMSLYDTNGERKRKENKWYKLGEYQEK